MAISERTATSVCDWWTLLSPTSVDKPSSFTRTSRFRNIPSRPAFLRSGQTWCQHHECCLSAQCPTKRPLLFSVYLMPLWNKGARTLWHYQRRMSCSCPLPLITDMCSYQVWSHWGPGLHWPIHVMKSALCNPRIWLERFLKKRSLRPSLFVLHVIVNLN